MAAYRAGKKANNFTLYGDRHCAFKRLYFLADSFDGLSGFRIAKITAQYWIILSMRLKELNEKGK